MQITRNNIYPKLFVISPEIAKEINFLILFFKSISMNFQANKHIIKSQR